MDLQIKDTKATGGGCGCGDCGCGSVDTAVMEPVVATCNCGPDCTCGCQDGKPCTCGDTTSSASCNCGPDCTCGCQDGKPCTCGTDVVRTEASTAPAVGAEGEGTSTYHVSGMTCEHCVKSITEEVSAIHGVTHVDVDLATGLLRVTSEGPLDFDRIVEAVAEAGDYTVE